MTAIFLDIDGVLNNLETSVVIPGRKVIGVEDEMLERLRKIWDLAEEPVIVLTSTWKEAWEPESGAGREEAAAEGAGGEASGGTGSGYGGTGSGYGGTGSGYGGTGSGYGGIGSGAGGEASGGTGSGYGEEGAYLDEKLGEFGMKISSKTEDEWEERGAGIWRYLEEHPEITKILILDDFSFDFKEQGLYPYWVRTEFEGEQGGLQDSHVKKAARILRLQNTKSFQIQRQRSLRTQEGSSETEDGSSFAAKGRKKRGWLSWLRTKAKGEQ